MKRFHRFNIAEYSDYNDSSQVYGWEFQNFTHCQVNHYLYDTTTIQQYVF